MNNFQWGLLAGLGLAGAVGTWFRAWVAYKHYKFQTGARKIKVDYAD